MHSQPVVDPPAIDATQYPRSNSSSPPAFLLSFPVWFDSSFLVTVAEYWQHLSGNSSIRLLDSSAFRGPSVNVQQ